MDNLISGLIHIKCKMEGCHSHNALMSQGFLDFVIFHTHAAVSCVLMACHPMYVIQKVPYFHLWEQGYPLSVKMQFKVYAYSLSMHGYLTAIRLENDQNLDSLQRGFRVVNLCSCQLPHLMEIFAINLIAQNFSSK
ncbi:unnamed protein product [Larinioides sclopetarius]|uniref:Uncharacterized protein n=1 Tax=Larinioides sclopetarius TaxID=280406 RepID=A0AAV1ZVT1_9ARAC